MKTHLNHKIIVGLKDTVRRLCLELIPLAHILEQHIYIIRSSVRDYSHAIDWPYSMSSHPVFLIV